MNSPLACLAEARIQESLEQEVAVRLPGHGQPLDLDGYFAAPSALRSGFGLLKSAGILPPEVEAMKQAAQLRERLAELPEGRTREAVKAELQKLEVELSLALERMKRQLKADAVS